MDTLVRFLQIFRPLVPERFRHIGHFLVAEASALLYGLPSRGMLVVGITGTNGKSTVVSLLQHILTSCGFHVASLSSVYETVGTSEKVRGSAASAKNTMPGWFEIQRFFRRAKKAGCQICIIEVTSEGIKQHRHRGVFFDRAAITNMQPEHIESHGSFEAYREAKGKLFESLSRWKSGVSTATIVNLDDSSAYYYAHFDADEKWGYGMDTSNVRAGLTNIIGEDITVDKNGVAFSFGGIRWTSSLVGDFNVSNILCAITVAMSFKIDPELIRDALKSASRVPGRLQVVSEDPLVIVDYAHTPDALDALYRNVRSLWLQDKGKVIAVLGAAGGGRDRWKRKIFGQVASRYAGHIILTNEDPYTEEPELIVAEIAHGITGVPYEIVLDRKDAIAKAITIADSQDAVVISGKGSERTMQRADGAVEWSDQEEVKEALARDTL